MGDPDRLSPHLPPRRRTSTRSGLALGGCLFAIAACGGGNPVDPGLGPADPAPPLSDVTFSDSTFASADWTVRDTVIGPNGGSSSAAQRNTGGNGGPYREVVATKNSTAGTGVRGSTWVYSIKSGAMYTPSQEGAIRAIDFSIDGKQFVQFDVSGGSIGVALRQEDVYYFGPTTPLPEREWTRKASTELTQDDFRTHASADEHPDFSASGGQITFGVIYGVSTVIDGPVSSRTVGLDNWEITIDR